MSHNKRRKAGRRKAGRGKGRRGRIWGVGHGRVRPDVRKHKNGGRENGA